MDEDTHATKNENFLSMSASTYFLHSCVSVRVPDVNITSLEWSSNQQMIKENDWSLPLPVVKKEMPGERIPYFTEPFPGYPTPWQSSALHHDQLQNAFNNPGVCQSNMSPSYRIWERVRHLLKSYQERGLYRI